MNAPDAPPIHIVRPWSEHPLALPVNLSWVLAGLLLALLLPLEDCPRAMFLLCGAWIAVNVLLTAWIWRSRRRPTPSSASPGSAAPAHGSSLYRDAWRRLRRNQVAAVSAILLVLLMTLCFSQQWVFRAASLFPEESAAARFCSRFDHLRIDKAESFAPPSARHWFGTDELGRDLFARTLYGGRISFLVGLISTAVSLVIGIAWGAAAGYYGGRVDHYLMRIVDVLYGLPFMFLVILILTLINGLHTTAATHRETVAALDRLENAGEHAEAAALAKEKNITRDIRTAVFLSDNVKPIYAMFFALGLVSWLTMARIVRGQVLTLRERDFVIAARTIGAGAARIIGRHIIPNLLGPVIVYTTLTIPANMLAEAFLSFIGLGIAPPECSWGSLASSGMGGINQIKPFWWLIAYPALAISLALFSLNFLGDGLRDALDPRSRA